MHLIRKKKLPKGDFFFYSPLKTEQFLPTTVRVPPNLIVLLIYSVAKWINRDKESASNK